MAERRYIEQLVREGTTFDEVFLLAEKELRTTNAGKLFVRGMLQDRSGQCRMIIWEATEKFYEALPRGGFVRAKGRVELYQNRPQLIIEFCAPVDESRIDLAEFLPSTSQDVAAMEAELREHLSLISGAPLKALADAFLEDEDLMNRVRRSPAAKTLHHAYLGGLLEHTVSMMRLADVVLPLYPVLNADLLRLGVLLHDIGKTQELSCDREFGYTDAGQLVGHLVQSTLMVDQKVRRLRDEGTEIPDIIVQQIMHLILAHHGEYEYGSPKLPMTAEAVALHYLDNIDAKLQAFARAVDNHPAEEETWTSRQFMFDNRMLFRGTEEDRRRRGQAATEPTEAEERPHRKGGID